MTEETQRALLCYHWPGNVRELQNVIERAVIMTIKGHLVGLDSLPLEIQNYYAGTKREPSTPEPAPWPSASHTGQSSPDADNQALQYETVDGSTNKILSRSEDMTLASVERALIFDCLQRCDGNRTQAAEIMGV
ncbi:helix-turn-helix domain-containing protein, partial [Arthrospira platensis SPKY1]|nr:helix-turn-helix domain-containing protein [Arthrospira platensis SPKY1]